MDGKTRRKYDDMEKKMSRFLSCKMYLKSVMVKFGSDLRISEDGECLNCMIL